MKSKPQTLEYGKPFNPYHYMPGVLIPNGIAETDMRDAEKILFGRITFYIGRSEKDNEFSEELSEFADGLGWTLNKLKCNIRRLKKMGYIASCKKDTEFENVYTFIMS